jgi:hypothetical protein
MQELPNLVAILAAVATVLAARLLVGCDDAWGVSGVRGSGSGAGATGAPDPQGPRAPAGGERDPGRVQGYGTEAPPSGRTIRTIRMTRHAGAGGTRAVPLWSTGVTLS